MKVFSSKKRVAAIGAATAVALVGGGTAFAYWTASGTDTSTVSTGSSKDFQVEVTAGPAVDLVPGGDAQTYTVKVTNPAAAGVQRLSSVAVRIGSTATDTWTNSVSGESDCTADDFTVNPVSPTAPNDFGDDLIPSQEWVGTFSVSMDDEERDQDACQDIPDLPLFVKAS